MHFGGLLGERSPSWREAPKLPASRRHRRQVDPAVKRAALYGAEAFHAVPNEVTAEYLHQQISREAEMPSHYVPTLVRLDMARDQLKSLRRKEGQARQQVKYALNAFESQATELESLQILADDAMTAKHEALAREQKAKAANQEIRREATDRVQTLEAEMAREVIAAKSREEQLSAQLQAAQAQVRSLLVQVESAGKAR
eukprot:276597-Prymnesium_polylepis.1